MIQNIKKIFVDKHLDFSIPPKNKTIAFLASDPFLDRFFYPKDYCHIHHPKDKLNVFIFLKMLTRFKFSYRWYYATYIDYIAPKFTINCAGDPGFVCIPPLLRCETKTIFIESSLWNPLELEVMSLFQNSYPKSLTHLLCVSQARGEMIQKTLSKPTTIVPIGSLKGNSIINTSNPNLQNKQITLSFISQIMNPCCSTLKDPAETELDKISWEDKNKYNMHITDGLVAKFLANFCEKNKIKLQILGRHNQSQLIQKEREFFNSWICDKEFVFLPNLEPLNSYKKAMDSDIVVTIDSTLGLELFGRGKKVAFFSCRGEVMKIGNGPYFGWPDPFVPQGEFFCNYYSLEEFSSILLFLISVSNDDWNKLIKEHERHTCINSPNNQLFLTFCKQHGLPLRKEYE